MRGNFSPQFDPNTQWDYYVVFFTCNELLFGWWNWTIVLCNICISINLTLTHTRPLTGHHWRSPIHTIGLAEVIWSCTSKVVRFFFWDFLFCFHFFIIWDLVKNKKAQPALPIPVCSVSQNIHKNKSSDFLSARRCLNTLFCGEKKEERKEMYYYCIAHR